MRKFSYWLKLVPNHLPQNFRNKFDSIMHRLVSTGQITQGQANYLIDCINRRIESKNFVDLKQFDDELVLSKDQKYRLKKWWLAEGKHIPAPAKSTRKLKRQSSRTKPKTTQANRFEIVEDYDDIGVIEHCGKRYKYVLTSDPAHFKRYENKSWYEKLATHQTFGILFDLNGEAIMDSAFIPARKMAIIHSKEIKLIEPAFFEKFGGAA